MLSQRNVISTKKTHIKICFLSLFALKNVRSKGGLVFGGRYLLMVGQSNGNDV
jgi:hypothetical protein